MSGTGPSGSIIYILLRTFEVVVRRSGAFCKTPGRPMDRRITRQVVSDSSALLWLAALAASSGLAAARSLERSWVVRSLLKAGASLPKAQLSQPFLCLRLPLEAETARSAAIEAWVKLQSDPADVEAMRLQLAAGCLLGERQTVEIGWQDLVLIHICSSRRRSPKMLPNPRSLPESCSLPD